MADFPDGKCFYMICKMIDSFLTIAKESEGSFKDKGSRFLAFAFPVDNEEKIKSHIQALKKEHYSARHHCYAWRVGADKDLFRTNDDGEPSSTAGKPILGQIQKFDLSDILIVVVRYFGGTLLGTSGLIRAYKEAAADALQHAEIIEKIVEISFWIEFGYEQMNNVMKIIKERDLSIKQNEFDLHCRIRSSIRKNEADLVIETFKKLDGVHIQIIS